MRIIPAIDIIDGKCVRLSKGDFTTKKIYSENPLEVAIEFEAHGIEYLHLVDLDGARARHIVNYKVLESIASRTNLKIDFGGGLKSDKDLEIAFSSGARQVTGGSIALKDRLAFTRWISEYGADRIILGADAKDEKIAINGWEEASEEDLVSFIRHYQQKGIRYVICTDIDKDGMLEGPSLTLYSKVLEKTARLETVVGLSGVEDRWVNGIALIASGGISGVEDLDRLKTVGCEGAIIGKALYENRISLVQLEQYILSA
jgi:phosphoribosylformimino-5-aminoimidazole carboxamide ribotide isomerase